MALDAYHDGLAGSVVNREAPDREEAELLTVQEAAQFLRVTVSWIYEHVRPDAADRLPVLKVGKYLRFDSRDLRAYIDGYRNVLRKHLLPSWRDWRLRDIGRADVQQWVAEKFRQGQGWQTVRNSWVLLSGILETAVEYGYLSMNPARGVKFPQKALRDAPAFIAGADFTKLLGHLEEPYRTMLSLIAATGLRIGELLALRWRALDFHHGTLAVRESVFEGQFQPPKTLKARRTIPLGPNAMAALQAHRQRVTRTAPEDVVFGNRKGQPLRESKLLRNVLQPAAIAAGLGRVTWHQFRHIHSSLLNDLKVPVKIAQEQLGHASISTTLNIYTHVVDASHRQAIEAVERELFPTVPNLPNRQNQGDSVSAGVKAG